MLEISGKVIINVLDKDTHEILDVIEQSNVITRYFYYSWTNRHAPSQLGQNIHLSTSNAPHYEDWCTVSSAISDGFIPAGVTSPIAVAAAGGNPDYIQFMRRFNPPVTTRIINSISLSQDTTNVFTNNKVAHAYVSLVSPCTQTSSQILDVYYRIQGINGVNPYNYRAPTPMFALGAFYGTGPLQGAAYMQPDNTGLIPIYSHALPSSNISPTPNGAMQLGNLSSSSVYYRSTSTRTDDLTHAITKFTWDYSTSQGVGDLHGSMSINQGGLFSYATTTMNITAPNGSKIQPIFSHANSTRISTSAIQFLDSTPSSGTGVFNMTGTWEPGNLPELYRIDIVNGGAVGTATYKFSKRNHFGFIGTGYKSQITSIPGLFSNATYGITKPHTIASSNSDHTNLGYGNRMEKYNNNTIVMNDQTGVSRYNIINHLTEIWDATSTPALLATNIRQIAVKPDDGTIWVACANTGIYKISANGLTITNFTTVNGLPSNNFYALDIGRANSIWAVYNGGVVSSFDNGTTWTTYNSTPDPVNDSYYNSVTTLTHLNALVDEKGGTITASGGAVISATQSKFGGFSASFTAATDEMTIIPPSHEPFLSRYVVEFWVYPTVIGGSRKKRYIHSDSTNVGFTIFEETNGLIYAQIIETTGAIRTMGGVAPTLNTWQHIALVFDSSNAIATLYKNGVFAGSIGTALNAYSALSSAVKNIKLSSASAEYFVGYIDEVRITKNVVRYPVPFTPPTTVSSQILGTPFFSNSVLTGDWTSIQYMKVDPSNSEDRIAIIRSQQTPLNINYDLIWWSVFSSSTITGYNMLSTPSISYASARISPNCFNVSDTNGFWSGTFNNNNIYQFIFGNTISTAVTGPDVSVLGGAMFVRNSANTADLIMAITNLGKVNLYNSSLQLQSSTAPSTGSGWLGIQPESNYLYLGNGVVVGAYYGDSRIFVISGDGTPTGGGVEHLLWDNYGWDGAQWVKNHTGAKTTHSGNELMLHGINANFVNGVTGTSFIAGDYYTGAVCDGILKNNAMTMSGSSLHFYLPTTRLIDFDGVIRTYPWTTGAVTWRKSSASITINPNNSLTNNIPYRSYGLTASSKNRVFGDFVITGTFVSSATTVDYAIGIKSDSSTEYPHINQNMYNTWGFTVIAGSGSVYNNNTVKAAVPGFAGTITWEISRVGNTITIKTGGITRWTDTDSSHSFMINARFTDTVNGTIPFTIQPVTVVSSGVGYFVGMGNSGTGTGIYNTKQTYATVVNPTDIQINGTPVQIVNSSAATIPVLGTCSMDREHGLLFFNAGDVGKTVTGEYMMSHQVTTPCNIPPV